MCFVCAQDPPKRNYILLIDSINGGNNIIPQKVKYGSSINVQIKNVNVFKVRLSAKVEGSDVDFGTLSDPIKVKASGSEAVEGSGNGILFKRQAINGYTDALTNTHEMEFMNTYASYKQLYQKIQNKYELFNDLETLTPESVLFIRDINAIKSNADLFFKAIYKNSEEAYNTIQTDWEQLDSWYSELLWLYKKMNIKIPETIALEGKLSSKDKNTTFKIEKGMVVLKNTNAFYLLLEKLKAAHEKIGSVEARKRITDRIKAGIFRYNAIKSETFTLSYNTGTLDKDSHTITPQIQSLNKDKIFHTFKPVVIKTYGRLKINGSAGYFINFMGDDHYSVFKDTEGNTAGVEKQEKNKIIHALGTLLHVYWQSGNALSYGLSAGAGINQNNAIGFYLGGSVFAMEKDRLVATAGISFVPVNTLNRANLTSILYEDGNKVPDKLAFISPADTELRYDALYKPAFFMGVTYNLFK